MGNFSGWGVKNIDITNNYVFYEHLKETYPDLRNTMKRRLDNMVAMNIPTPGSEAVSRLRSMAQEERQREQAFLNNAFSVNLNFELNQSNTKDFIDTFNAYMQLDKIYDMRKALLLHSFGKEGAQNLKDAYSFFNTYLADSFQRSKTVKQMIANLVAQSNSQQEAESKINNYINQIMPTMVGRALDKLSKSKSNNTKQLSESEKQQVQDGLRAINDCINQLGRTQFGNQIIRQLGLSNFSKVVAENASNLYQQKTTSNLTKRVSEVIKDSNAYLKGSVNTSGGLMLELVENASLQAIANGIQGKNVRVIHSGSTGMKADNIMLVMTKPIPSTVDNILQELQHTATSRKSNIEAVERLEQVLGANGNNGFIIYFSDKNHFMNTIIKDKNGKITDKVLTGFSSGVPQSLKNFEPVLSKAAGIETGISAEPIIQAIMQTLSGAIGYEKKEDIRSWLTTLFAYFLFDDVGSIGTSIKGSTLTALHIMDLNGVYIPLSVILDRFAAALESSMFQGMSSPSAFVSATISAPKIKYDYEDANQAKPKDAWIIQREEAYNSTKVGISFLKNIRELISGYLDQI